MPFGLATFSALVFSGQNIAILGPMYTIGCVLANPTWQSLVIAITPQILFILTYFIFSKLHKKVSLTVVMLVTMLSSIPYIVFCVLDGNIYECIITTLIGIVFAYIFCLTSHSVLVRGAKYRQSVDEKIACALTVGMIALALNSIKIENINILYPFFAIALMVCAYSEWQSAPLYLGVIVGVGACFSSGVEIIAIAVVLGIIAVAFRNLSPVVCAFSIDVGFVFAEYYFDTFANLGYINVITVTVALLIYLAIPKKKQRAIPIYKVK